MSKLIIFTCGCHSGQMYLIDMSRSSKYIYILKYVGGASKGYGLLHEKRYDILGHYDRHYQIVTKIHKLLLALTQ